MTFGFEVTSRLDNTCGRTGLIHTPHGVIQTPAFVVVGTKATVKALLPESVVQLGAQAVLANAYHLFLQPGAELIDEVAALEELKSAIAGRQARAAVTFDLAQRRVQARAGVPVVE